MIHHNDKRKEKSNSYNTDTKITNDKDAELFHLLLLHKSI